MPLDFDSRTIASILIKKDIVTRDELVKEQEAWDEVKEGRSSKNNRVIHQDTEGVESNSKTD